MLRSRIYVHRSMQRTAGVMTAPIIDRLISSILDRKPRLARAAARELTLQMLAGAGVERDAG